ncbi:hypothetical protein [uncultured Tateyamaria sp.]|uniref:hypothetical protein n=1 Tax=uncultured Tateyamaria sp. TaxID=455651 RepID=UPI00260416D5|nr:hypothetical protein [uncultured Tateyamaria sp.]
MMMNWMITLIRGSKTETTDGVDEGRPQVTRDEVADLFAADLARPVLQKRAKVQRRKPRRFTAVSLPMCA